MPPPSTAERETQLACVQPTSAQQARRSHHRGMFRPERLTGSAAVASLRGALVNPTAAACSRPIPSPARPAAGSPPEGTTLAPRRRLPPIKTPVLPTALATIPTEEAFRRRRRAAAVRVQPRHRRARWLRARDRAVTRGGGETTRGARWWFVSDRQSRAHVRTLSLASSQIHTTPALTSRSPPATPSSAVTRT